MNLGLGLSFPARRRTFPSNMYTANQNGFWYDPGDISTLYQDDLKTTPVTASGNPVGYVEDKSGNANPARQATAANKPTYQESGSLRYLTFNGTSAFLGTGLARVGTTGLFCANTEKFCVAGVFRLASTATGSIIGKASTTATSKTFQIHVASGNLTVEARGVTNTFTGVAVDNSAFHSYVVNWDGATLTINLDGQTMTGSVGTAAEETTQNIVVGAIAGGTASFLGGSVGDLIVRDESLTQFQLQDLTHFLKNQYGI